MRSQCVRCGNFFTHKRRSAKFCSDNCRVQFNTKGTVMGEKITNALWEIKRISAMLDNDRSHWGAEAHEGARRLNEELCNLFARTDFLNQSELHNFRYRKDK